MSKDKGFIGLDFGKALGKGDTGKAFEAKGKGTIRIVENGTDLVLLGHKVSGGDIWRSCQVKDLPIKDWVKLAVTRCRANNFPNNDKPCKAIFWLDSARPHDVLLMRKVKTYLKDHDDYKARSRHPSANFQADL